MTTASIAQVRAHSGLGFVVFSAGFFAWLGDFLFWGQSIGASVAVFVAVCAIFLWRTGSHGTSWKVLGPAALLLVSCGATVMEISFSNLLVMAVLLSILLAECHFPEIEDRWARWSESMMSWLTAPIRWLLLIKRSEEYVAHRVVAREWAIGPVLSSMQIVAPALCLVVVFGVVLSAGNAVFHEVLVRVGREVFDWFFPLNFSPVRATFWLMLSTFALVLTLPRTVDQVKHWWVRPLGPISRANKSIGRWQSVLILVALNGLFFAVNTIDVVFLWSHSRLPAGVSFSEFVHQGVYSLIFAVLLSAVVIAAIFQQEAEISMKPALKLLGWLWIVQNWMMIAGVFLRLKLYVDAYQLSELRVYVGCFLALITVGFALLALHVAKSGNLGALLWRNAAATFALFFVMQFCDVAGAVARFNVEQWKRNPQLVLDLKYMRAIGPAAWPALCEVARTSQMPFTAAAAGEIVLEQAELARNRQGAAGWRGYQMRTSNATALLLEEARVLSLRNAVSL